ncbi:MAG TPA: energy transducer TonB, partial [Thermoanaerobaculia bacterium]
MFSALRLPALLAAAVLAASALACASAPPADPSTSAAPADAVPFDLETMTAPRPLRVPQPEYTPTARRARWQGRIASEVLIDEEGRVREVRLLDPAPYGLGESIR